MHSVKIERKHLARRADSQQAPPPHRHHVVSVGQGSSPCRTRRRATPFLPELSPVPQPQPQATPKHTWNQISSFSSLFHTPQLVHKIFLFYIFYTNVTKRWEGRGGGQYFMPINGWGAGGGGWGKQKHTVSAETRRVLTAKRGGKEASETEGVDWALFSGETAPCGR